MMPWFFARDSHDSIRNTYSYFLDHNESAGAWHSNDVDSELFSVTQLMQAVILAWIPLTLLFIVAILLDYRMPSLILGSILTILGIGAAVYFAGSIAPAVSSSLSPSISMRGLFGSTSSGVVTWSWGPGLGWFVFLAGVLVILAATIVRTYVVVNSRRAIAQTLEKQDSAQET